MPLVGQLEPLTHVVSLNAGLRNPAGVEVLADGTALVADLSKNQIARIHANGALIGNGSVAEGPIDIAANATGTTFYISLRDLGTVAVYDNSFNRTGFLGDGNAMVSFVGPTDIDVATNTGVAYVVDAEGDTVYGFNSDGTLALKFGFRGALPGEFMHPSAIAADEANGRLIVADQDNYRIQVFTTDGMFICRFGYRNIYLPGELDEGWMPRAQGLAVDTAGRIYVVDAMMNTVRVFDPNGTELGKILDYDAPPTGIRAPFGMALNGDVSKLCVISTGTANVEVFETPTFAPPVLASHGERSIGHGPRGEIGTNWSDSDAMHFGASVPLSREDFVGFLAKRRSSNRSHYR